MFSCIEFLQGYKEAAESNVISRAVEQIKRCQIQVFKRNSSMKRRDLNGATGSHFHSVHSNSPQIYEQSSMGTQPPTTRTQALQRSNSKHNKSFGELKQTPQMNFLLGVGKSPANKASFVVTGVPLAAEGEQQAPEEYQHLPSRISNNNPLVEPIKPEEPFLSRESGTQADSKIFTNDIMQHIVVDPPVIQNKVHVYTLPGRHQHLLSPQNEPRGFKGLAHKVAGTPQANAAMMLMASTTTNKFQHTLKVRSLF